MSDIVQRGNTVFFSFVFKDENGDTASATSATLQLFYAGRDAWQTESLTLTLASGEWSVTWDSTKARAGWVQYHAHAVAVAGDYAQDGRFKLTGNNAGFQHDLLPTNAAGLNDEIPDDYE